MRKVPCSQTTEDTGSHLAQYLALRTGNLIKNLKEKTDTLPHPHSLSNTFPAWTSYNYRQKKLP